MSFSKISCVAAAATLLNDFGERAGEALDFFRIPAVFNVGRARTVATLAALPVLFFIFRSERVSRGTEALVLFIVTPLTNLRTHVLGRASTLRMFDCPGGGHRLRNGRERRETSGNSQSNHVN
jgi:hypothetical protein